MTNRLHFASNLAEWYFRGGTVLVSLAQIIVLYARKGQYCTHSNELLKHESHCLLVIVYMQVAKVVIFSFWQAKLTEWK